MDDGGSITPLLITILLILFADFAAVSETALASVSKVRMKTLADHGNQKAQQVLDALDNFDRTISTLLICTNIAHLAIASIVTVEVTKRWGLSAVTISTLITSLVLFFIAEMLPKSIAKKYSEKLSLWCIPFLTFLIGLFRPVSLLLAAIGSFAAQFVKGDPPVSATEEEIQDIIEDMTEEGTLDEEHGDLISSALEFNDLTVESILTPRVDVCALDIDATPEEMLEEIRTQNHSRLPVYEGNIDHIIGILQIRKYIRSYLKEGASVDVRSMLDEPFYVTENAKIDELLPKMSRERQSIAIVTDHYGGTVGIVTTEDILETLVGDIWDEDDVVEDPCIDLKNGSWLVDAEETVTDTFWNIGFDDPEEDESLSNKRIGEWVFEHFQEVPEVQESFVYHGLIVSVASMDHNRILKVMIRLPKEKKEGEETV
ncbi:MAG TPA: hypothetical protein DCG51_04870 [Erysipelotrichaceae bacterium]|nr:hypothetical protein [Erysipelotrichaceae bacterium]